MSRQSAAALAIVPPSTKSEVLAPRGLTTEQRRIWREVVASMPANHFRHSDEPQLRTFVEITSLLREATQNLGATTVSARGKLSHWFAVFDRCVRLQGQVASALRISASSRVDPLKAGRNTRHNPPGATKALLASGPEDDDDNEDDDGTKIVAAVRKGIAIARAAAP